MSRAARSTSMCMDNLKNSVSPTKQEKKHQAAEDHWKKKDRTAKDETQYYASVASVSWVQRIYFYQWGAWKIFWICAFVLGLGLSIVNLTGIFVQYFQFPSTITLNVITNDTFEFPAVTVCNINPIKLSLIDDCDSVVQLKRLQQELLAAIFENDDTVAYLFNSSKAAGYTGDKLQWLREQDPEFTNMRLSTDFDDSQCTASSRRKRQTSLEAVQRQSACALLNVPPNQYSLYYQESCYLYIRGYITNPNGWHECSNRMMSEARLAVVPSQALAQHLKDNLLSQNPPLTGRLWVGGVRLDRFGDVDHGWYWGKHRDTSAPFDDSNHVWADGEPNIDDTTKTFANLRYDTLDLTDRSEFDSLDVLCESRYDPCVSNPCFNPQICVREEPMWNSYTCQDPNPCDVVMLPANHYTLWYNGKCYVYGVVNYTPLQALEVCRKNYPTLGKGTLAKLDKEALTEQINEDLFKQHSTSSIIVGAFHLDWSSTDLKEGWAWLMPDETFENFGGEEVWVNGEPNNSPATQNCSTYEPYGFPRGLRDVPCTDTFNGLVCEFDLEETTTTSTASTTSTTTTTTTPTTSTSTTTMSTTSTSTTTSPTTTSTTTKPSTTSTTTTPSTTSTTTTPSTTSTTTTSSTTSTTTSPDTTSTTTTQSTTSTTTTPSTTSTTTTPSTTPTTTSPSTTSTTTTPSTTPTTTSPSTTSTTTTPSTTPTTTSPSTTSTTTTPPTLSTTTTSSSPSSTTTSPTTYSTTSSTTPTATGSSSSSQASSSTQSATISGSTLSTTSSSSSSSTTLSSTSSSSSTSSPTTPSTTSSASTTLTPTPTTTRTVTPTPTASQPTGLSDEPDPAVFAGVTEADRHNYEKLIKQSQMPDFVDITDLVVLSKDIIAKLGYTALEFILDCTYDRKQCKVSENFIKFESARTGNCFTYNSGKDGNTLRLTRKSGSSFGLRLTLNIDRDNYVGLLASEYGAVVMVHHPSVIPLPEDDGIKIKPGQLTSLGVRRRDVHRLSSPYGSHCTMEMPDKYSLFVPANTVYDLHRCRAACTDYHMKQICDCVDRAIGENACDLFNQKQRECRSDVLWRMAAGDDKSDKLTCECHLPCKETMFTTTVSQAEWPSSEYRRVRMFNFHNEEKVATAFFNDSLFGGLSSLTRIKQNLVRLHVHLDSLSFENLVEEPSMTVDALIANVGGLLGIYLGVSMVAFLELIEFLVLLCQAAFTNKKKSKTGGSMNGGDNKDKPNAIHPKESSTTNPFKISDGGLLPPKVGRF